MVTMADGLSLSFSPSLSLSLCINICLLKGLAADAADPDRVAFKHTFDADHVSDCVIGPMIDRMIDPVIRLD